MDGRGRGLDNVFMERLWRDVKYEQVFLPECQNGLNLHLGLKQYFPFRNEKRPHQALGYKTPKEIYTQKQLYVP